MGPPLHCYACADQGWILGKLSWAQAQVMLVMSSLRLQTHLECIPHPCHMYTECFITLICHGWAYGCTLTLLGLCNRWAGVKENWGMAELEWCCNIMVEAPNPRELHPISISYVYKVFQHLDMLWMGTWVHPHTVRPMQQVGGGFKENWGMAEPEWCCNVVIKVWSASHIHIIWIQSLSAPWYAVDRHMSPPLHC